MTVHLEKTKEKSVQYLSDGHLFFAGYGEARTRETLEHLRDACAQNDIVVLNGDMFELPFSRLGFARTVARALSVLEFTLRSYPETQLHYTIGNHDADPVFVYELKKLAQEYPNFQVTEKHLLLGTYASTHGDLQDTMPATYDATFKPEHKVPFYSFYKDICIPAQFTLNRLQGNIPKRIQEKGDRSVHRRLPYDSWMKATNAYFKDYEPEIYQAADTFMLGHTHHGGAQEYEGKSFRNSGVAFDAEKYVPAILPLGEDVYTEYCTRTKEEPILEPTFADKRALKSIVKIEERREERANGLDAIMRKPGHYVDSVMEISKLYKEDAPRLKQR